MTPDLCPDCRENGIVATRRGPTCTHPISNGQPTAFKWPENYAALPEQQRVDWWWANRTTNEKRENEK